MKFLIQTDGGARPTNPGPSGFAVVVKDPDTRTIIDSFSQFTGVATNNQAEYWGLLSALMYLLNSGETCIHAIIEMDSELIIKQMRGEYACRDEKLRSSYIYAKALIASMPTCTTIEFKHIPRELNADADALATAAILRGSNEGRQLVGDNVWSPVGCGARREQSVG